MPKRSICSPAVGDQMPGFILPDHEGRLVSLDEILDRGPAVVAFHRGHWCPFCRLSMTSLAEIEQRVKPAQIVAISTETQRYTRMLREQTGAMFPVLTDMDAAYTMSLNLAVWVDTKLAGMISEAGWDIPLYQGGGDWVLPIPSVFVVRQDGTIAARHIDPDYRQRMEIDELLSCVQDLG
jgi:peroxiredoxin